MQPTPSRAYGGRSADDRRAERRSRFVDAAFTVFSTTGYAQSSVPQICAEARLSSRQFYADFSSREALLREAYDQVNEAARAAVTAAAAASVSEPFQARVRVLVRAYLESVLSDPRRPRLAFVEVIGVSPEMEEHRKVQISAWIDVLQSIFRSAVDRGEIDDRDFRLTSTALIGATNALVNLSTTASPALPVDVLVDELSRIAAASTLPPPS
ncbi:TetR/AcrR family transcriptional regulator [Rhodococcoides fascians]|uniref:TetR/AcrR family transcriptional regulator n=1 Tax=Rhodococcoides fascians TaxID=1828 RepID=UPI0005644690|nr:TetR/AcrR family transcriptional regulator [Rhodococcus fascians]